MMTIVPDPYEVRARFAPALIVTSPWLLLIAALVKDVQFSAGAASVAALVFLALLYMSSFVVRRLGRRIEGRLWESWGGPPSAVVLTDSDTTFSLKTKADLRMAVTRSLGIQEASDPQWAMDVHRVQEAFRLVRQHLRLTDPQGLWFTHNAEYGFLRNLWGSWWLWLLNSILSGAVAGLLWHARKAKMLLLASGFSLALGLAAIALRSFALPAATRIAAFRYAESAWTSFLYASHCALKTKSGGSGA